MVLFMFCVFYNLKRKTRKLTERINEERNTKYYLPSSLNVLSHTFGLFIKEFLPPHFTDEKTGTQRA